ncbi:glucose PTS transporter transcription antiterminator GlcT [Bacillus marinisedimentorum]|uniref:glucose PTS transporter transcription antiterminator GlcT n=1 Tax=Bacillus marinisedimentorum TaxID=1821260 RepID=UPI000872AB27|nr:transcription antiterminator [Bacillus marinisedimentorum]
MAEIYTVKKVLNNNVLIASHASDPEVVLIGKGIGFGKKNGETIQTDSVEKIFTLANENEQEQYKQLLFSVDEKFIGIMHDVISYIEEQFETEVNEHIHIALTDHIAFAIKRIQQGMDLRNPFLIETQTLYPKEYKVAEDIIEKINKNYYVELPEGEVGFVALHIHSALTDRQLSEINQHSRLITSLVKMIEDQLGIRIERNSVDYLRLVRHMRHTIDRVIDGEKVQEPEKLAQLLKHEYPLCYNVSWKLIKVMQRSLNKPVFEAEAVYLTMHLQRLSNKESK